MNFDGILLLYTINLQTIIVVKLGTILLENRYINNIIVLLMFITLYLCTMIHY